MSILKSLLIFISIIMLFFSQFSYSHGGEHLGQLNFPNSGSKEAQPYFMRGVMLLHSFQYEQARDNFEHAKRLDRQFALAYWGEAMTYNHPLWGEQEYQKAVSVLSKLALKPNDRVKKAKTPKEKGLISAVNQLYGKGSKTQRDQQYADAMRQLYRQFPQDDEIAILYSLALLGQSNGNRDDRTYMQAASIAEDVYERNKNHPGTLHYAIHAFDDPIHAPLGLRAARAYAKVAPSASHALHMPSHIFNAMGLWDDVIKSNQDAWNAGVRDNPTANPAAYTIHDLHALQWLAYAYLQKGNTEKAFAVTKTMQKIAENTKTPMALWYYAQMRAAFITDSIQSSAVFPSFDTSGVELSAIASNAYADVITEKSKCHLTAMRKIQNRLEIAIPSHIPHKTFSDYFSSVTKSGIDVAKIVELEIKALIAQCEKKYQKSISLLREAVKIEADVSFGYGPPLPVKPSFEMLADILMQQHKYKEAYELYLLVLKRLPNRLLANKGLQRAKQQLIAHHKPVPTGIKPFFHRLILPEYFH